MATAPRRVCSAAGCHALADGPRCLKHPPEPRRRTKDDRAYDDRRGSASSRGYDATWRRIRNAAIRSEPLCRHCRLAGRVVAASEVDHIIPLVEGGTHHASNLQPLCHPCHVAKTGEDQRRARSEG